MKIVKLSDACEVIAGQSPPSSTYNSSGQGIPFFQGKADFGYLFPVVRYWCSAPQKIALPNDILISVRAPVGPTNINIAKSCIGRGLSAIRCSNSIDNKFLLYFLRSNEGNLANKANGSTFSAITQRDLQNIEIPLPHLSTQQKIAAILDAADVYRQKTKVLIEKYDQLAQSVFLEMFGDPVNNDKGWVQKKLKDVCLSITDGTHFSPEPQNEGYPYVTAKHVRENGLDFYSKPTFISEEAHNEIFKRCKPEYGDVLYIKDGATTGIACINTFSEPISLLSSLALLKPDRKTLNNFYLCNWFNNKSIKEKLLKEYMSGAAIQRFTLNKINSFVISVPPITIQNQFTERIQLIEAQKQKAQATLKKADELFNSLLQMAFKGELVE